MLMLRVWNTLFAATAATRPPSADFRLGWESSMRNGRFSRLRLPWHFQNPIVWLGLFAAAAGLIVAPATAQGPPGAAAAAAGAAAAATASAPAPPPKKSAASAAMDAAAMGESAVAPASANEAGQTAPNPAGDRAGTTEMAANGPAPAAISPQVAADIASSPLPKDVTSQCANLLKLATLLKADVAKTTKDVLSISVVRDAGQVEEMAKKIREAQH